MAVRLVSHESRGQPPAGTRTPPAFRVCEKLRAPLATLMGQAGFRAILGRALALAGAEAPGLRRVRVRSDGSLEGLERLDAPVSPQGFMTANAVLVAELLGLLVEFIGEKLTLQLVRKVWPRLPVTPGNKGKGTIK